MPWVLSYANSFTSMCNILPLIRGTPSSLNGQLYCTNSIETSHNIATLLQYDPLSFVCLCQFQMFSFSLGSRDRWTCCQGFWWGNSFYKSKTGWFLNCILSSFAHGSLTSDRRCFPKPLDLLSQHKFFFNKLWCCFVFSKFLNSQNLLLFAQQLFLVYVVDVSFSFLFFFFFYILSLRSLKLEYQSPRELWDMWLWQVRCYPTRDKCVCVCVCVCEEISASVLRFPWETFATHAKTFHTDDVTCRLLQVNVIG